MSPILGIYASQISGHLWAPSGAYDALASVTANGSVSSVSFTGIPTNGYKHLQIRALVRDGRATTVDTGYFTINNDSSASYSYHFLGGNGASASAGGNLSCTPVDTSCYLVAGASAGANMYSSVVCDILDYANTNKYKTFRALSGTDQNGGGNVWLSSVLWQNTAAINSIAFATGTGSNWDANTTFALYGVK